MSQLKWYIRVYYWKVEDKSVVLQTFTSLHVFLTNIYIPYITVLILVITLLQIQWASSRYPSKAILRPVIKKWPRSDPLVLPMTSLSWRMGCSDWPIVSLISVLKDISERQTMIQRKLKKLKLKSIISLYSLEAELFPGFLRTCITTEFRSFSERQITAL